MKKLKFIKQSIATPEISLITKDKIYDMLYYNSPYEEVTIMADNGYSIIWNLDAFEDVTHEYRNDIIDEILS